MGGYNSGRRGSRRCTDDMRPLDIRKLNRMGLMQPGRCFSWQWTCNEQVIGTISLRVEADKVTLDYKSQSVHHNNGEWEEMSYAVWLERTDCGFGGERVWWKCPAAGCRRRVAVLYGGRVFACRQCHRLTYRSQREAPDDRACRRADTIRHRLGWEPGILNGNEGKPKGMHRRTYERLQASHDANVRQAAAGEVARMGALGLTVDEFDWPY